MRSDLAQSYGQDRLPRYTSYPTAPHFSPAVGEEDYRNWLKSVPVQQAASIYLHVPFCRSMCWYCGCHTSVTKRDDPIAIYVAGLRTEAQLVAETIGQRMPISHVHFGGGTPTIMPPETFVHSDLREKLPVPSPARICKRSRSLSSAAMSARPSPVKSPAAVAPLAAGNKIVPP